MSDAALRVLIIGAGGHARVCLEALRDGGTTVVGAVSRDGVGADGLGVPMLGADTDAERIADDHGADHAFVAIGDNTTRAGVVGRWTAAGRHLAVAVSRFAMPSHSATLAPGVLLAPGAIVNASSSIGLGSIVNTGATVDHDCRIGTAVHLAPGVSIGGGVTIGDRTFVGLGARIAPGVTLGPDVVVGAGAVVLHDVGSGTVVGVPARPIERRR